MVQFNDLIRAVFEGDEGRTSRIVDEMRRLGYPADQILAAGLTSGLESVGAKFRCGEVFIPEVLASVRAFQAGLRLLEPVLVNTAPMNSGRFLIGTVQGDIHDVGKNLVAMLARAAGFEVLDLGVDVSPAAFVRHALDFQPQVVGMSALLTTTMPAMLRTIEAFRDSELKDKVRIIVGGAPVTPDFAKRIGADGYAPDAIGAVDLIRQLCRRGG